MSPIRAIQLLGVAAIGVLAGLACLNNLTDYNSNFALVQHVLSMDTTFPDSTLRWRAVTNPIPYATAQRSRDARRVAIEHARHPGPIDVLAGQDHRDAATL